MPDWLWNEEGRAQLFATGDGHDRVNRLRGGAAAVKRLRVWPLEHCWGPDGRQRKLPYVFSCRRFIAIGVTDTFRSSRTKGLGFRRHPPGAPLGRSMWRSLRPDSFPFIQRDRCPACRMPERGKTGISTVNADLLRLPSRLWQG